MAIAKSLASSTGNKSEMAVGYCTSTAIWGLAVIADVPKTRVYLCRWLNSKTGATNGKAKSFLPTTSSLSLLALNSNPVKLIKTLPYDILDDILQRLIHNHQSAAQIVAAGHDPTVVDRVLQLVARAEFKRRQAPPGITDRALALAGGCRPSGFREYLPG